MKKASVHAYTPYEFTMNSISWDNSKLIFGMINRRELTIYYPDLLNAMLEQFN